MTETNTVARALHDAGLAAWFGGSLMGAVGLNGASYEVSDRLERARVADSGWGRWTPVNAVAIAAHVIGGTQLTKANKARMLGQRGVGTASAVKTALTAAAAAATAYARVLGQRIMNAEAHEAQRDAVEGLPVEGATDPAPDTRDEVARAQQQLKALQWAIPALTGALLVLNARMGEQQRPREIAAGLLGRLKPDRRRS